LPTAPTLANHTDSAPKEPEIPSTEGISAFREISALFRCLYLLTAAAQRRHGGRAGEFRYPAPVPVARAASGLLDLVQAKTPVPGQLSVLPKQMMELIQR
jgi:hypothetical protein